MPALRNASATSHANIHASPTRVSLASMRWNDAVKHPATITASVMATLASYASSLNATRVANVTTGANALTIWMNERSKYTYARFANARETAVHTPIGSTCAHH